MNKTAISQAEKKILREFRIIQQHSSKLEESITQFSKALQIINGSHSIIDSKRGPGRPRKEMSNTNEQVAKRSPGRPRKDSSAITVKLVKRGPGRPRKEVVSEPLNVVKRSPGRPKKNEVKSVTVVNRDGRGRPSLQEILSDPLSSEMKSDLQRIEKNINKFNVWKNESTKERSIWVIENGTYMGVIEGFYSSGTSGKYGITTRVFVNPNSELVSDSLKQHIDTAAVNRIRYVETQEEGEHYIEKQRMKLVEEYFNEILPKIIKDHGKRGSVYAFHLNSEIRRNFNKLKIVYDNKYAPKIESQLVNS